MLSPVSTALIFLGTLGTLRTHPCPSEFSPPPHFFAILVCLSAGRSAFVLYGVLTLSRSFSMCSSCVHNHPGNRIHPEYVVCYMCFDVLCWVVLCCVVLCCVCAVFVLCCAVLCCALLCCMCCVMCLCAVLCAVRNLTAFLFSIQCLSLTWSLC